MTDNSSPQESEAALKAALVEASTNHDAVKKAQQKSEAMQLEFEKSESYHRAREVEAERMIQNLRDQLRQRETELTDIREQLHGLGSELASKTTELARHQLDLIKVSQLLEGEMQSKHCRSEIFCDVRKYFDMVLPIPSPSRLSRRSAPTDGSAQEGHP